jgi:hypothetical protein
MARWHRVLEFVNRECWALRRSRTKTIAALTVGLLRRQQVGQASIARGMDDNTTVKHRVKRIGRFVTNEAIDPWEVSGYLFDLMLPRERESLILVDWTDRGEYMMLKASLAFQRRALPLAWVHVRKWEYEKSQNYVEEQFILELASRLPADRRWVLVADRGFGRAALIRTLDEAGIQFVIRDADGVWVQHGAIEGVLNTWPREPNKSVIYRGATYHKTQRLTVNLVVCHEEPAPAPWFLITNLDRPAVRVQKIYAKRMGIEEGIRDCKSGLDLTSLRLSEPARMDRMMIIVALAMLFIALTAMASKARGENLQVSTSKRKAPPVSYFTLGCRILEMYPEKLCTDKEMLYAA